MEQHLLGPISVQDRIRAKRMAEEAKQGRFKRQPLSGRDYAEKPQERTGSMVDRQCPRGASARHGNHVVSAGLLSESRNKQGRGLYRAQIAGINARYAKVSYVDHGEFDVSEEQSVLKATSLILTICSPGKNTTPRIALEQEIARNAAVKSR
jgi:hypothetical protein